MFTLFYGGCFFDNISNLADMMFSDAGIQDDVTMHNGSELIKIEQSSLFFNEQKLNISYKFYE